MHRALLLGSYVSWAALPGCSARPEIPAPSSSSPSLRPSASVTQNPAPSAPAASSAPSAPSAGAASISPQRADEIACAQGTSGHCNRIIERVKTRTLPAAELKQAHEALELGCEHNDIDACASMGDTYRMGHGVSMDIPKAKAFFQKACELGKGEIDACTEYAEAILLGKDKESEHSGMRVLERACSGNVASACSYLGLCYTEGLHGVPYNPGSWRLGVRYYEQSCTLGRAASCHRVCSLYRAGHGVAKNAALANQACKRGCQLGDADACEELKKP